MNNRFNKFVENTVIFAVSNFASKILIFFMLPFYTRVLTTSEFGTANLLLSLVTTLIPIFTLCVSEGALRFSLSKSTNKKSVFTYGLIVIGIGFFILLMAYPICKFQVQVSHLASNNL